MRHDDSTAAALDRAQDRCHDLHTENYGLRQQIRKLRDTISDLEHALSLAELQAVATAGHEQQAVDCDAALKAAGERLRAYRKEIRSNTQNVND